ncbi:GNAT family N-acetyltransferase [Clostridium sp. YIM B02515]|uniref:GNAT family N-acetyltransferase n=1 Tax=Clostridium rhizosphaerae TaxID=2803861 RepID=A0ABS1T530_9CLOT|nr:GNAT family N-acetyltransferase [Clostridium rhizosphaerae]MBL4934443.1 GNAT family N-acetyltransferase [Clostridium rhizosphaerae]
MRIEALKNERVQEFIDYCKKYRREVDESFLYDEDLEGFTPDLENPTYIIVDDGDKITAAASLIVDDYMKKGKKGRFRIFHSSSQQLEHYKMLLRSILNHTEGLDKIMVFSSIINKEFTSTLEKLNFNAERYSFFLLRESLDIPEVVLPKGYIIRSFQRGRDEEIWCEVRNSSFAKLLGSETPQTPEMISKMNSGKDYVEGGAMILYDGNKAVGVVRASKDEYEDLPALNIGPLAIIPEYQGKGLGKILLRAALAFAGKSGYSRTVLCVNAENDRAKALYLQEGFKQVEAVACYKYDI